MSFFQALAENVKFKTISSAVDKKGGHAAVFGLLPIHRSFFAGALSFSLKKSVFLLCESEADARTAASDLDTLGVFSLYFPARDLSFREVEGENRIAEIQRLSVLGKLETEQKAVVVCCSVKGYCQTTILPQKYYDNSFILEKKAKINRERVIQKIIEAGYTRSDRVEGIGQFSVRGGLIDIFSPNSEVPFRVDFFGDEIESVFSFDTETQRRKNSLNKVKIIPAREFLLGKEETEKIKIYAEKNLKRNKEEKGRIFRDLIKIEEGKQLTGIDFYRAIVETEPKSIEDYLPHAILFLSESKTLKKQLNAICETQEKTLRQDAESNTFFTEKEQSFYKEFIIKPEQSVVFSESFSRTLEERTDEVVQINAGIIPCWNGERSLLQEDLREYSKNGYSCLFFAGTERSAEAHKRDLEENSISIVSSKGAFPPAGTVCVQKGCLSAGFDFPFLKICCITGALHFSQKKQSKVNEAGKRKRKTALAMEDLHTGDYVVHQNHGIGRYEGIVRIDHHGYVRDYIKIQYRGADVVYIPVTQTDLLSQYISPKNKEDVTLAKLHSGEWNKTKQAVYRSVKEMAEELMNLYAKREKADGIAFSADTEWQRDFEARFSYDETEDQLRAAEEIKRDMEKPRPMDRLLCGDVGVGKTEVALRAVFKCVAEGYQCAVLVPTTILAWQHFHTFKDRLEPFPITVAMLSRFSSPNEISETLNGLKKGTVDIVIGTHRLLQKDVQFKKIGLLVVDEEQRFGVSHKEKVKQVFPNVDVLTLSATPIPRTLNMALSGIRDMSVIEEPPLDRYPVQTYIVEHDDEFMNEAIRKEMSRGGQVYYLHNRIETIEKTASKIAAQHPSAVVEVAHGRMNEEALSKVWKRVISGESDILVCTTIIETGIDIPNVNTLIVEDADYMGLAQLYQIRGRVGRSGRRAFAYFTFRRDRILTETAEKRLSAIRDFTSFGSGFKIAMRDMQIRGAGNVLSAKQSGHMAAVGYDMYLKILDQVVQDERGLLKEESREIECTVDMQVSAYIPESYIHDDESRIEMYKRIAEIATEEDASEVREELQDRFGKIPESTYTLLFISLDRAMGGRCGFYEIKVEEGKGANWVTLYSDQLDTQAVANCMRKRTRKILAAGKGKKYLRAEVRLKENAAAVALEVLKAYAEQHKGAE